MNAGAGETVLRILQDGDPGAILRFGSEADLVAILKDPVTSMACDCGASTATRVHPRFYGSYPRVLGRYVREQQIMSWEEVIRKSSWLPASTIGMTDRGLLAPGMAADIAVFDPATIIDRATYESPAEPSIGMRYVLVNGRVVLDNGAPTGARPGRALFRTANMPSRPTTAGVRTLTASGTVSGKRVTINLTHRAGARAATGTVAIDDLGPVASLGVLQITDGWASFTASVKGSDPGARENVAVSAGRAVAVIVDLHDPANLGGTTVAVDVDGAPWLRGSLPIAAAVMTRQ
jgi:hypothetical protein